MRLFCRFYYLFILLLTGCLSSSNSVIFNESFNTKKLPDHLLDKALQYAPIIFQEAEKDNELHDFILPFNFDGDNIGNNNEENLLLENGIFEAVVYFSILETSTHFFITYSFFHPLDWDKISPLLPYSWHENDMENIQIVIQKHPDEKVILLAAQAHLNTNFYSEKNAPITSDRIKIDSLQFFTESGDSDSEGTHCGIFIESGGHAIYSSSEYPASFLKDQQYLTFFPGTETGEYFSQGKKEYQYRLIWTYSSIWKLFSNGSNSGNGKLFDGTFNYIDNFISYQNLPRHFDSDRYSGPFKTDSGITPFAFSFNLLSADLGVLFFNPTKKYEEQMNISSAWSRKYLFNCYLND